MLRLVKHMKVDLGPVCGFVSGHWYSTFELRKADTIYHLEFFR
jgi:hypothetical protein